MKDHFTKALDAYLEDRADEFQTSVVEHYCHKFTYRYDVGMLFKDAERKGISTKIIPAIRKMMENLEQ